MRRIKVYQIQRRLVYVCAMLVLLASCGRPYQYAGTLLDPPKAAAPYALIDHQGQPFVLGQPSDKLTVVYFGYTHCPDFCPTTMGEWKQVRQQLGGQANNVRFVLVSVDPARDTEQVLGEYVTFFDPTFIGVRPTAEQVQALSREYGVGVDSHAVGTHNAATAPTRHGLYTYVLDNAGQLRLLLPVDADAAAITSDLKQLLRES